MSMPVYAAKKNKWTAKDVPLAAPTATYMFAHRDTCDLCLDYYKATPGSALCLILMTKCMNRLLAPQM